MTATTARPAMSLDHLRTIDLRSDLLAVADLIELCFANTMDPDGREYLRQMRQAARDANFLRWAPVSPEPGQYSLSGFVWEENSRVVGNLTLIPLARQAQPVFLIANVAVHPEYRRRGIAHSLTQAALEHAAEQAASSVWLQVRDDNRPAIDLYRGLGFVERSRRTTWVSEHGSISPPPDPSIMVAGRRGSDWPTQRRLLTETYPPEVSWNLPFNVNRLRPGLFNGLVHFLLSERSAHWAAREKGRLTGIVTWEPTRTYADNLWLGTTSEREDQAILALLPVVRRSFQRGRPLALNYPAGRAVTAITASGFTPQQTLIWMEKRFFPQLYLGE